MKGENDLSFVNFILKTESIMHNTNTTSSMNQSANTELDEITIFHKARVMELIGAADDLRGLPAFSKTIALINPVAQLKIELLNHLGVLASMEHLEIEQQMFTERLIEDTERELEELAMLMEECLEQCSSSTGVASFIH